MKMMESKPITMLEAKEMLTKRCREIEPGYEQKITLDFLRRYVTVNKRDISQAINDLREKVSILKEHQIMMLVNLVPQDEDDIKLLFQKERINLKKEQTDEILKIIKKIKVGKIKPLKIKKKKADTNEGETTEQ